MRLGEWVRGGRSARPRIFNCEHWCTYSCILRHFKWLKRKPTTGAFILWDLAASGGYRGEADEACATALTVPRQAIIHICYKAQVFRVSQYHFAHQQGANFRRSWHQKAGFWKQILKNFLLCGLPHSAPIASTNFCCARDSKPPSAGTQTIMPIPMVPLTVPQ